MLTLHCKAKDVFLSFDEEDDEGIEIQLKEIVREGKTDRKIVNKESKKKMPMNRQFNLNDFKSQRGRGRKIDE